MAQTPNGGANPYLTAARLWLYRDARPVLDLLADDDTRPTRSDAEDATTDAGKVLAAALAAASGDVEQHAMDGGKYLPEDLAAIVTAGGNGAALVERLIATLAFWHLTQRRYPAASPEDAGATAALDNLKALRAGEVIFGTVEAVAAGNESVTTLDPGDNRRTVRAAARLFGNREPRGTGGLA